MIPKYIKKIFILILLATNVLGFIGTIKSLYISKKYFFNIKPAYLFQKVNNDHFDFVFSAKLNNLGQIQFLVNNEDKKNNKYLIFSIKQKGDSDWYYIAKYDSSLMDSGQYYPFGFPVIQNSKGNDYLVSIKYDNSKNVNISDYYAVYYFPRNYIISNASNMIEYVFNKVYSMSVILNTKDLINLYLNQLKLSVISTLLFLLFNKFNEKEIKKSTPAKTNLGIILILIINFLTHFIFVDYSQYWDSANYLTAIKTVSNLTNLHNFIESANFQGHPTMGYVSVQLLGQYLFGSRVFAINLVNIILKLISIYCFYKIVLNFYPNRKAESYLSTLLFSFSPLFFATTISLNVDFPVLVFSVIMFYSVIYNKNKTFLFSSILMIFSKETGVLIYITFFVSYLFQLYLKNIFNKSALIVHKINIIYLLFPLIVFTSYLLINNFKLWSNIGVSSVNKSEAFIWNDDGMFNFGLNSTNILARIVQIFVMNFNWLFILLFILTYLKSSIYDESIISKFSAVNQKFLKVLAFVFINFVLFNLVYIVMPFSRYVVESVFFITIFVTISLNYVFNKSKKFRLMAFCVFILLSTVQTFYDIDPSTKLIYGYKKMGIYSSSLLYGYADGMVYNAQFAYFDFLSNKIIEKYGSEFLIKDNANEYFFKNIKFNLSVNEVDIETIRHNNIAYFIHFPWFKNLEESLVILNKFYDVKYNERINVFGYYADIYKLTLK